MRERLKHKYALSEQGVNDMIKAVIIVTIANLAFMVPVGLLYLLASDILNGGIPSSKLPMYIGGMVISILLIIITTYFQYNATFLATYVESGVRRRTLAEKLRKIPLSFFGKKDLQTLQVRSWETVHGWKQQVLTFSHSYSVPCVPQRS